MTHDHNHSGKGGELWMDGSSTLQKRRAERRKKDEERRRSARKVIKAEEVRLEWEEKNGVYVGGMVSADLGFENRIIEVDCHIYPPHTYSVTHKHNEAIIFVLRGEGYTLLDDERHDWKPGDTLYIGAGIWHQHHITSDEPAMVIAIKPIPIQEYIGELNIIYKGDEPKINEAFKDKAKSFIEEFKKINSNN